MSHAHSLAALVVLAALSLHILPLARALSPWRSPQALLSVAFLLGSAAAAIELLALSLLRIPWTRLSFGVAMAAVFVTSVVVENKTRPPRAIERVGKTNGAWLLVLPPALYFPQAFAPAAWDWTRWLPSHRDFFYIWGAKGRAFYENRGVDWTWLSGQGVSFAHADYPPLAPLLFDAIAIWTGWEESSFAPVYLLAPCALLILSYEALCSDFGEGLSTTLATLALSGAIFLPSVGLADPLLVAYVGTALLVLRLEHPRANALAFALFGIATLVKNEGIIFFAIAGVVALWRRAIGPLAGGAAIAALWLGARAAHDLRSDLSIRSILEVPTFTARFLEAMSFIPSAPGDRPLYWLMVVLTALVAGTTFLLRERLMLFFALLPLPVYIAAIAAQPYEIGWNVTGTWNRLSGHILFPLAFAAIAALLRSIPAAPPPDSEAISE